MVETVIVGNGSMKHKHRGNLQVSYGQNNDRYSGCCPPWLNPLIFWYFQPFLLSFSLQDGHFSYLWWVSRLLCDLSWLPGSHSPEKIEHLLFHCQSVLSLIKCRNQFLIEMDCFQTYTCRCMHVNYEAYNMYHRFKAL